ncbi:EAL domain-containing protein [Burkholderiaceae bacterium UC74_6]
MPLSKLHFLVVEDHAFQRKVLTQLLEMMGAGEVLSAPDGQTALEVLARPDAHVDVVICDLHMPGMDGMEFIRHLAMEERLQLSLILLSALDKKLLSSIATMARAYGVRLLGCASKPLTAAKLLELLERHEHGKPEAQLQREAQQFSLEEMGRGLEKSEFEAFMQPKVEIRSGKVWGVEALARWRHPWAGVVNPSDFVPQMEQGGLIDGLTWAMLEQSSQWLQRWQREGLDLCVSVNLSIRSLAGERVAERVTEIVRSRGVDPGCVMLEVTESAAATDTARALENLARLRMLGFGLSIDDYGTGYSSMQQLSRIAFTELKIDRAFVTDSRADEATRVILSSSLDMARRLGIHAVAEGVESAGDWALLEQLGCDLAQGWLISRPMEAAQFEPWVRDWRSEHGQLAPSVPVPVNAWHARRH